jgi:hypothetical protein
MINVFYNIGSYGGMTRGPTKVVKNLLQSLDDCNIFYRSNEELYEYNLFLGWDDFSYNQYCKLKNKENVLIGPQIWPWSSQWNYLKDINYSKIIAPSKWVNDKLNKFFPEIKTCVWPVAIYSPEIENDQKFDCLVYYKNRSENDLNYLINFLNKKNISYVGLQYGNYTPDEFIECLSQVKYCIILDNTESQGIAIQEMMACNKPLLVWDMEEWDHMGEQFKVPATSVPYWSSDCGEKFYEASELEHTFDKFYADIDRYNPKKLIDSELSYKVSVEKLLNCFEN